MTVSPEEKNEDSSNLLGNKIHKQTILNYCWNMINEHSKELGQVFSNTLTEYDIVLKSGHKRYSNKHSIK